MKSYLLSVTFSEILDNLAQQAGYLNYASMPAVPQYEVLKQGREILEKDNEKLLERSNV